MLAHRLLLGPILIAVLALLLWLDGALEGRPAEWAPSWLTVGGALRPGVVIFLVLVFVAMLTAREAARFAPVRSAFAGVCVVASALAGLTAPLAPTPGVACALAGALAMILALLPHWRTRSTEGAATTVGVTLFAFVFLGLMPSAYVLLRQEHSAWTLLAVILAVKATDIGAYFTGRSFGKRKMAPWLSPGKTWEGFAGGAVSGGVVGALAFGAVGAGEGLAWLDGALVGVVLAGVGQLGDLMASLLKRSAGVKDSGRVPGFGGVLDIVDSAMLAAPAALALVPVLSS